MVSGKRIAVVSVINDLVTDSRVLRTAAVLAECGYSPLLIGRKLPGSLPLSSVPFKAERMKLLVYSGPAFYLLFQIRLFVKLLFTKSDLLFSNDLDTLLPSFLISRIKKVPLIYDSHEIFCEVPELQRSAVKKKLWELLEKFLVPRCRHCITVNESIARYFEQKYGVRFYAVRNIPAPLPEVKPKTRQQLGLPADKKIIIMQGAGINVDRGAEELLDAMEYADNNTLLLIIGGGDVWPVLKRRIKPGLEERVRLLDKLPKQELNHYTRCADIGVTIDKNTNLNYQFSLPNKLFDYIHAGLPVLASPLPEIMKIVSFYKCGAYIETHSPEHIAAAIKEMLEPETYKYYKQNSVTAAGELTWETEKKALRDVIQSAAVERSNAN